MTAATAEKVDSETSEASSAAQAEEARLERSTKGDLAARLYFVFSGLFFLGTVGAGLLWAASVMSPEITRLSEANAQVAPHGNLLPVFWNLCVYGWLSSAAFGSVVYIVPRITGAPLKFSGLLVLNSFAWAGLVAVGALAVSAGFGRPSWLLEYPVAVQLAMAASAALVLLAVLLSTMGRLEPRLYPSLWYFTAALIWLPVILVLGGLPLYAGVGQAIQGAFVAHSVLGLWLFVVAAGVAYYIAPKASGTPLYSRRLAQISLWGFALFWVFSGGSRLVFSPTSGAYQSTSIAFAIASSAPLLATVANLASGFKGSWSRVVASPVLRWVTVGVVALGIYAVVMPISTLRSLNQVIGLTGASSGVDILLLFGVVGSWLAATAYYALPRISGREWALPRLIDGHIGFFVVGVAVVAIAAVVGGAAQGFVVNAGASAAMPASFGEAWERVAGPQRWFAGMAAVGWLSLLLSAVLAVMNGTKTLVGGSPSVLETVTLPEELEGIRERAELVPEETRKRIVEPTALPLISAAAVVVLVYFGSRILIAVQRFGSKTAATAVALVMAGLILGVASLLAAMPKLKSQYLAAVVVVAMGVVLGGGAVAQSRLAAEEMGEAAPGVGETEGLSVTLSLSAVNVAFDEERLEAPAGARVGIEFENKDVVQHNFALYRDEQMKEPLFRGELIGAGKTTYVFDAPSAAGTYYFFCDVHPNMKGTFEVTGGT